LKLDADKEQIIRDKYKVKAYPTLLFLNSDGSVLARIVGYQIPSQFIETLQGVIAAKGARASDPK
jgi:thioredoxin-related protein